MKKVEKNYTAEELVEVKELVDELDQSIDSYVEDFKAEGKSILINCIIADIAKEMDVDLSKLRSFLRQNGSKYFPGVPLFAVMNGKVMGFTLFHHYKTIALNKLKKNVFLEEIFSSRLDRNLI